MKTLLMLMLFLGMPICEAAEWLTYCTTDKGVKVREDSSKKWYTKAEHQGGSLVKVTTKKRLKHVQLTCTSTVEAICAAKGREDPAASDKPNGEWTYEIAGTVHPNGVFCAYFWAQP